MAKLCPECKNKKPDLTVRGTCQAPNLVLPANLPQKHTPWTDSPNFTLCDECAEHFGRCAWCWGSLEGSGGISVPTDKQFCRQFDDDNGGHVEGMYVGEQILAQLTVDLFSGVNWGVDYLSPGVQLYTSRFVWEGGRYGWMELYFNLNRADPKAVIKLKQYGTRWWVQLQNPQTWAITVEVKQ